MLGPQLFVCGLTDLGEVNRTNLHPRLYVPDNSNRAWMEALSCLLHPIFRLLDIHVGGLVFLFLGWFERFNRSNFVEVARLKRLLVQLIKFLLVFELVLVHKLAS